MSFEDRLVYARRVGEHAAHKMRTGKVLRAPTPSPYRPTPVYYIVIQDHTGQRFDPVLKLTCWSQTAHYVYSPDTIRLARPAVYHSFGTEEEARAYVEAAGSTWGVP